MILRKFILGNECHIIEEIAYRTAEKKYLDKLHELGISSSEAFSTESKDKIMELPEFVGMVKALGAIPALYMMAERSETSDTLSVPIISLKSGVLVLTVYPSVWDADIATEQNLVCYVPKTAMISNDTFTDYLSTFAIAKLMGVQAIEVVHQNSAVQIPLSSFIAINNLSNEVSLISVKGEVDKMMPDGKVPLRFNSLPIRKPWSDDLLVICYQLTWKCDWRTILAIMSSAMRDACLDSAIYFQTAPNADAQLETSLKFTASHERKLLFELPEAEEEKTIVAINYISSSWGGVPLRLSSYNQSDYAQLDFYGVNPDWFARCGNFDPYVFKRYLDTVEAAGIETIGQIEGISKYVKADKNDVALPVLCKEAGVPAPKDTVYVVCFFGENKKWYVCTAINNKTNKPLVRAYYDYLDAEELAENLDKQTGHAHKVSSYSPSILENRRFVGENGDVCYILYYKGGKAVREFHPEEESKPASDSETKSEAK